MSKVVTPILFFIIAIGLFFTYIRPAYDVLLAFQQQEAEIEDAIKSTEALVKIHDSLMSQLNSIDPVDRNKIRTILPESVDIVRLILDLDVMANRHDIQIEEFEIPALEAQQEKATSKSRGASSVKDEKPYNSAVLVVQFSGDYPDFKSFLEDVEHSLVLMDVVSMEVEVPDFTKPGTDNDSSITYKVGLQVYWIN